MSDRNIYEEIKKNENFEKRLDLVISSDGGHIQDKLKLFLF